MNSIATKVLALILATISISSCGMLKRKPSKKAKAKAEKAKQIADSISLSLKNQMQADSAQLASVDNDSLLAIQNLINQTSSIWQSRLHCQYMSAKAKMHYDGGDKSLDFVANIRMRKDSIIWVSVNVAGIVQVARAIITPDSFKAVMYTEREAYIGPISKANQILPEGIDFYSLQNLILGNPILEKATAQQAQQDSLNYTFRMMANHYVEQLNYNKSDSTLSANQLITTNNSKQSLHQVLSNFLLVGNKRIATDRKLSILTEKNTMLVEMNFSNITFDEELSFPFSIPKNYMLK